MFKECYCGLGMLSTYCPLITCEMFKDIQHYCDPLTHQCISAERNINLILSITTFMAKIKKKCSTKLCPPGDITQKPYDSLLTGGDIVFCVISVRHEVWGIRYECVQCEIPIVDTSHITNLTYFDQLTMRWSLNGTLVH